MIEGNSMETGVMSEFDLAYDAAAPAVSSVPGPYMARAEKVTVGKSKDGGYPQLNIDWVMTDSLDEAGQAGLGATVSDRIVLWPESVKSIRARMHKQALQRICKKLELDIVMLVPKRITSKQDLQPLCDALQGKTMPVVVKHSASKDDPNTVFENIGYSLPRDPPANDNGSVQTANDNSEDFDEQRMTGTGGKKKRR